MENSTVCEQVFLDCRIKRAKLYINRDLAVDQVYFNIK